MPVKRLSGGSEMPEHDDLVSEIPLVEKMSTAERLKHAKKRRITQLKKYSQYEKQLDKEQNKRNKKSQSNNKRLKKASHDKRVIFVNNVMLLEAAARNDIEEVKSLLSQNVSPDVTNEDGLTALHQCCIDDLEEMLRLLLDHGASVNAKDSEMWTPLHAAATCGHIHLCRILIDSGAELLSVNADGNMPYDICEDEVTLDFIENEMAKRGVTQDQIDETRLSTEVKMLNDLQKLSDKKGDLEFRGRVMETPLHIAAANGYVQVTEFLMKHNVSINVEDDDSWQPIHAAACWGHLPVLELLVQHGADLDAKTKNGETPYDICEDMEMRERLMELKSEIAAKGQVKSRNLVRRRSTNTRSASVRRVSSKEKGAISFKEAVEEGRRLRESVSDNEDDDLNTETAARLSGQNGANAEETKVEDVQVFMPVTEPSPKPSPRGDKEGWETPPPPPPVGWGDEDDEPSESNQIPPPPIITSRSTHPQPSSPKQENLLKPVRNRHNQDLDTGENIKTAKQEGTSKQIHHHPQKKSIVVIEKSSNSSSSSPKTGEKKPIPQSNSSKNSPPSSTVAPIISHDSVDPTDRRKQQKKSAPKPPSNPSHENDNSAEKAVRTPSQSDTVDHHIIHAGAGVVTPERRNNNQHDPTQDTPPPQGTLSDLKKQRASKLQERLQESLRFRDGDGINSEIKKFNETHHHTDGKSDYNNSTGYSSGAQQQQYSNGQNGKVQSGQPPNNNKYGYVDAGSGDTIKKYHFSDTTSVLGDNDEQTSCCIIM